jgi:hypothetical protein
MSTNLQTPPGPPSPARRPVSRRALAAAVAGVLVAGTAAGALAAAATDRPAPAPAGATATPAGATATPPGAAATPPGDPLPTGPARTAPPVAAVPPTGVVRPPDTVPPRPPNRPVANDVDGDGRADAVSVPAPGTVRVRYATGATDTVSVEAMAGDGRLQGVVDADADGRAEVFVHVGTGAYSDQTSVLRYVDGRLRVVTLDGRQVWLVSGASVRNGMSWACRPPQAPLVQWQGESDGDRTYRGTLVSYRFAGAALVQVSTRPLTVSDRLQAPTGCAGMRT